MMRLYEEEPLKFTVAHRNMIMKMRRSEVKNYDPAKPDECRHTALNYDVYAQFTSPIRRYFDLAVHRLIAISLENGE